MIQMSQTFVSWYRICIVFIMSCRYILGLKIIPVNYLRFSEIRLQIVESVEGKGSI